MAAITSATSAVVARPAFVGKTESLRARAVAPAAPKRASVVTLASADETSRRAALSVITAAGVAAVAKPSLAAYGDSANIWGATTNTSGFIPYSGDGYAFLLPSKYNPSKERPFPNQDVYFEDNFDAVTNISVMVEKKCGKSKIEDFGSPEAYLEKIGYLLGQQVYAGETRSEGGFAANKVSAAAVLDVFTKSNKGKTYYYYEVLTRTADGDEGGRHQLIAATVSDGDLYTMKLQSGDKRWFKGQERDLKQTWSSFTVA
ncbi:photosystem II oxygen-evolving complex 23 kDa protein, chloroplast precursor [Micromonas pusilla CCMP1545]|uniref:Photosystem II oxygen-evolving complex 23 kDa protein, chloroplast n=1 Tax=Micromonas pusilla (strain CCMP1545) TaxID=564608 RepID=C1MWZ0_MICPC|nr:photosystem II oxygen-evolving complex 23 kDa protein, chloroplast precursor [Micromonas pusilla CCMP1545]EEH55956.1 photosystem II oxygen-evolving complex 23 kDa protein, chloroplast precursor [Micromonas pusilla CCMP1545]|eukprot:XP_003060004.1 photosystem II oxygen-evolving complex 23 kDa protein, chloroplast precursor [Micromonas pusilla CCMP1545]